MAYALCPRTVGLMLVRAPSGIGCREPSLRLGPSGSHPVRLRAPLAHANPTARHTKLGLEDFPFDPHHEQGSKALPLASVSNTCGLTIGQGLS